MTVEPGELAAQLDAVGTSPVLSWIDVDGRPASARVSLGAASTDGVVVEAPGGLEIREGRANLMAHFHNERLWDLKSVCFTGRLASRDGVFVFVPERQIGDATQGQVGAIRMLRASGRAAQRYLARRGLPRPPVDYRQVAQFKRRAREMGID